MKKTTVVNLYGAPGAGKSTTMAAIFYKLKMLNVNCEMAAEFAKDLVWEDRHATLSDQIYIFAKQNHRLHRLMGKVDVIITDAPIALSYFYASNNQALKQLVSETYMQCDNMNVFVQRVKPYNPAGRLQDESGSDEIGKALLKILDENSMSYHLINGNEKGTDVIVSHILQRIAANNNSQE